MGGYEHLSMGVKETLFRAINGAIDPGFASQDAFEERLASGADALRVLVTKVVSATEAVRCPAWLGEGDGGECVFLLGDALVTAHYRMGIGINFGMRLAQDMAEALSFLSSSSPALENERHHVKA